MEVVGLVTTINAAFDRVAMHGVRRAGGGAGGRRRPAAARLPIPYPCPNEVYEAHHGRLRRAPGAPQGVQAMAFGDLFLEDIRRYREAKLAGTGIAPLFPLWGIGTGKLAREMIAGGLVPVVTCVDPRKLPASFAGRRFDRLAARHLPAGVDPCAENGEFHTFACAGPMFCRADCGRGGRGGHPRRLRLLRPGSPLAVLPDGEESMSNHMRKPGASCCSQMRIVSLIASATEIVCALGTARAGWSAAVTMRLSGRRCCAAGR